MSSSDIKLSVSILSDVQFGISPAIDILAGVKVPEQARDFQRGPRSLFATAVDQRDIIVACGTGALLEHPNKQPLLYVVYCSADPPYLGRGLEQGLVNAMLEAARELHVSGVWLSDDIATLMKSAAAPETEAEEDPASRKLRWWNRILPSRSN